MCGEETMFRGSYLLEGKMSKAIGLTLKLLQIHKGLLFGVFTENLCPETKDVKILFCLFI